MVLMTAVIAGFAEYGSDLVIGHVPPTVYGYDQCVHCDLYLLPTIGVVQRSRGHESVRAPGM